MNEYACMLINRKENIVWKIPEAVKIKKIFIDKLFSFHKNLFYVNLYSKNQFVKFLTLNKLIYITKLFFLQRNEFKNFFVMKSNVEI